MIATTVISDIYTKLVWTLILSKSKIVHNSIEIFI